MGIFPLNIFSVEAFYSVSNLLYEMTFSLTPQTPICISHTGLTNSN